MQSCSPIVRRGCKQLTLSQRSQTLFIYLRSTSASSRDLAATGDEETIDTKTSTSFARTTGGQKRIDSAHFQSASNHLKLNRAKAANGRKKTIKTKEFRTRRISSWRRGEHGRTWTFSQRLEGAALDPCCHQGTSPERFGLAVVHLAGTQAAGSNIATTATVLADFCPSG